ncbi:hypothetical protein BGZ63DRAFT_96590 [Mariannaea sp. PMI_226]|nr:hypothetical protein BGZ63DRAFT_96590 [Mariannaea sp. PMI_226]
MVANVEHEPAALYRYPVISNEMSIALLPTEVQCSILRLLDPIGLISISQTNRHFRQLVNPKKRHFIERLLALESTVEYGGITPIFRSRDNTLEPDFADERWNDMRWACTGCMRLLHRQYFDTHAILRLKYRKPIPGSVILEALTTWEPDPRISFSAVQQKLKSPSAIAEEKSIRQRYLISVTFNPNSTDGLATLQASGVVGFEGLTTIQFADMSPSTKQQILDDNALAIELKRCGYRRHLRKCLGCRYQAGQLTSLPKWYGRTSQVPIVVSRKVAFASRLKRYFKGFANYLRNKKPSFNALVYRHWRKLRR